MAWTTARTSTSLRRTTAGCRLVTNRGTGSRAWTIAAIESRQRYQECGYPCGTPGNMRVWLFIGATLACFPSNTFAGAWLHSKNQAAINLLFTLTVVMCLCVGCVQVWGAKLAERLAAQSQGRQVAAGPGQLSVSALTAMFDERLRELLAHAADN